MNPALNGIWENMRELGLAALSHANRHSAYLDDQNGRWSDLSVLQAAHAAELLVKARIAQEHPLLIFDRLPKVSNAAGELLEIDDLFRSGQTIQWSGLPDRLWAATGIKIDRNAFLEFGQLRNGIQHFSSPDTGDSAAIALKFIFSMLDPFINNCWGLYAVDYDEDHDPYVYFVSTLIHQRIPFLVSPAAAHRFDDWSVDWSKVDKRYARMIKARVAAAVSGDGRSD